jgi:superoxide reductase
MAERLEVYKCELCGNIIEVLHGGAGELVCCGVKVKVGSVPHPMEEKHYIEWIELIVNGKADRQFLKPGQVPEAVFKVESKNATAREYCNLHGLWKG